MKKFSTKFVIPMAAVAILGASAFGVTRAAAASTPAANKPASLVQQIASTFGLDPSKVQAVFDAHKTARQQSKETRYAQRLSSAVTDGKLTSTQEQTILAEHNKLNTEVQAAQADTGSVRRQAMMSIRQEARTWAQQNNVSATWLRMDRGQS